MWAVSISSLYRIRGLTIDGINTIVLASNIAMLTNEMKALKYL